MPLCVPIICVFRANCKVTGKARFAAQRAFMIAMPSALLREQRATRLHVRDGQDEHSRRQHGSDPDKSRVGSFIHRNILSRQMLQKQ
jgi:hypothetical protein